MLEWRRRGIALLGLISLLAIYITLLAGAGLQAGFTYDDLMNLSWADLRGGPGLIRDNIVFFRPSLYPRPLGELFYLGLFRAFELEPQPYRYACHALLIVNAALLFWLGLTLTNSWITAALASFLHAYHPNFWPLYFNSGTAFDLLCCLFSLACLIVYYRRRARDLALRPRDVAALLALFVAALNSKELALALPGVLALDEALRRAKGRTGWLHDWGGAVAALGAVGAAWVGGRLFAAGGLTENEAYAIDLSFGGYADYLVRTFADIFYVYGGLSPVGAGVLLAGAGSLAALLRDRAALVGWLLFAVGSLPVAVIPPRALSASYLPTTGIALWIAAVVMATLGRAWPGRREAPAAARAALAAALVAAVTATHVERRRGAPHEQAMALEANEIRIVKEQLESLLPHAQPGERVLFLKDPFFATERLEMKYWATVFLFELLYDGVKVDRVETLEAPVDPASYDYVFTADGLKVERLR